MIKSTLKTPYYDEILERLLLALETVYMHKRGRVAKIAKSTGYSSNQVSWMLMGKVPLNERFIKLLCAEYHISEEWVKFGTGKQLAIPWAYTPETATKEEQSETDYVKVPRYKVHASAGGGSLVESEQIVDYLQFSKSWLTSSLGITPDHLVLISVIGDSMSPTYNDGDLILVDTANNQPKSDAVYVIQHEGYLWVKRLNFRFDGSIHVISDNARYPEQVITGEALDRLKIVGRVMWRGGR